MLYIHHGKKPECSMCNINFEKERHLIEHMRNVHNKKLTYSCHICGKTIKDKEYVKKHIAMVHEGKKPFKCPLCDSRFSMKQAVKNHIATVHGAPIEERRKKASWSCKICKKRFTSKGNLNTHIAGSHEEKKFRCEICNLSFGYYHSFKAHNQAIHEGIKNYFCNLCDSSFYVKKGLFEHFETYHEGNGPFQTEIIKQPGNITTKSSKHSGDNNFIILDPLESDPSSLEKKLSTKIFQNSPAKTIQVIKITKETNQICKKDEKVKSKVIEEKSLDMTTKDEGLKLHLETYSDAIDIEEFNFEKQTALDHRNDQNKPPHETINEKDDKLKKNVSNPKRKKKLKANKFKCQYCEDQLLSHSDLERHMLSIHGGKKPECSECNIKFLKERHLSVHMRNVHKTKLAYSCHICNAKISKKYYVKSHIETVHEGKKPFKCDLCISTFRSSSTLISHMKTSHGSPGLKKIDLKEAKSNCRKRKVDLKKDQTNTNKVSLQIKEQSNQIVDQLSVKKYHPNKNENQFNQNKIQLDQKMDQLKFMEEKNCGLLQSNLMAHMDTKNNGYDLLGLIKQALENVNNVNEAIPDPTLQAIKDQIDAVNEEKKLTSSIKEIKSVHEENKLLKCSVCKFSCELSIDLKRHILSNHGGQKTFNCAICDDTFEEKFKLKNHIESAHGKKVPLDSL
jgi:KRAB domain-containing zinc finger protein